jgi:hypothetical protein
MTLGAVRNVVGILLGVISGNMIAHQHRHVTQHSAAVPGTVGYAPGGSCVEIFRSGPSEPWPTSPAAAPPVVQALAAKDRRRNKCFNPSLRGASWRPPGPAFGRPDGRLRNPGSTTRTLPPRTRGFAARRAPLAMTFEVLIFPAVLSVNLPSHQQMGRTAGEAVRISELDPPADAGRQWRQRRDHLFGKLFNPAAAPPERASIGGMNVARVTFQNGVAGKRSRHHPRQRSTVRRSTPTACERRSIRAVVTPCGAGSPPAPRWLRDRPCGQESAAMAASPATGSHRRHNRS